MAQQEAGQAATEQMRRASGAWGTDLIDREAPLEETEGPLRFVKKIKRKQTELAAAEQPDFADEQTVDMTHDEDEEEQQAAARGNAQKMLQNFNKEKEAMTGEPQVGDARGS